MTNPERNQEELIHDIIYNADFTREGPDTPANRMFNPELFEESS